MAPLAAMTDDHSVVESFEEMFQAGDDELGAFLKSVLSSVRCVWFDDSEPSLHSIPSPILSQRERDAIYLSPQDMIRIRKENIETLKVMNGGDFPGNERLYFRGLETHLPKARAKRRKRIRSAVKAVLEAQRRGNLDQQWLDRFYGGFTSESETVARYMGQWDREAVVGEESGEGANIQTTVPNDTPGDKAVAHDTRE